MLNIQVQSQCEEIKPPTMGPMTSASASVTPIMIPTSGGLWVGPYSAMVTWESVYNPEPPTPWNARQTILVVMSEMAILRVAIMS